MSLDPRDCLRGIQTKLDRYGYYHGLIDGLWGPLTDKALDDLHDALQAPPASPNLHLGKLSSFADPDDVAAYQRCIAQGYSQQHCFGVGDNGEGAWGDNTAQETIAMVALPPEDIIEKWGSVAAGKHKPVVVLHSGIQCVCVLADLMPHRANITNGAICDLNPAAAKALNLSPPFLVPGSWRWG